MNTYPVSESFTGISVTDYYADVQLRVSRDGTVSVVTRDAEDVTHTVRVEGGTLTSAARSHTSASGCSTMRMTTPRSPSICLPATTGP